MFTKYIYGDEDLQEDELVPSRQKTLEEGVFVESAFNMRCHVVKNTLPHTAFSAILPAG